MTDDRWALVDQALSGERQENLPFTFWWHNYATENSAGGLAAETCRVQRLYDFDVTKPQVRAQSFAEAWGLRYTPSISPTTRFEVTHHPVNRLADLAQIEPVSDDASPLAEQLEAVRRIRQELGSQQPLIWTVFSPALVLQYMSKGGIDAVREWGRERSAELQRAIANIAVTLTAHVGAILNAGADGIFYATTLASATHLTEDECRRLHLDADLQVLESARRARLNVLHLGGERIHWRSFASYPVHAMSWDMLNPGNPTASDVQEATPFATLGGLPLGTQFASLDPGMMREYVDRLADSVGRKRLIVGAGGSLRFDVAPPLILAARDAARGRQASGASTMPTD